MSELENKIAGLTAKASALQQARAQTTRAVVPLNRLPYTTPEYMAQMMAILQKWNTNERKKMRLVCPPGWSYPKLRAFVYNSIRALNESETDEVTRELAKVARFISHVADESFTLMARDMSLPSTAEDITAFLVDSTDGEAGLKAELLTWLSDPHAVGEQFYRDGLALAPDDVEYFNARAAEVAELYTAIATGDMVRFVRGNADELRAWKVSQKAKQQPPTT